MRRSREGRPSPTAHAYLPGALPARCRWGQGAAGVPKRRPRGSDMSLRSPPGSGIQCGSAVSQRIGASTVSVNTRSLTSPQASGDGQRNEDRNDRQHKWPTRSWLGLAQDVDGGENHGSDRHDLDPGREAGTPPLVEPVGPTNHASLPVGHAHSLLDRPDRSASEHRSRGRRPSHIAYA